MNLIFVVNGPESPIFLYVESRAELGARFLIAKFQTWNQVRRYIVPQQFARDPETGVLPTWRVRGNDPRELELGQ